MVGEGSVGIGQATFLWCCCVHGVPLAHIVIKLTDADAADPPAVAHRSEATLQRSMKDLHSTLGTGAATLQELRQQRERLERSKDKVCLALERVTPATTPPRTVRSDFDTRARCCATLRAVA